LNSDAFLSALPIIFSVKDKLKQLCSQAAPSQFNHTVQDLGQQGEPADLVGSERRRATLDRAYERKSKH
jgi:hypothetical protein